MADGGNRLEGVDHVSNALIRPVCGAVNVLTPRGCLPNNDKHVKKTGIAMKQNTNNTNRSGRMVGDSD